MKRIYLIRHAKAVTLKEGFDFDRELNEKGLQDAKLLGAYLASKYPTPSLFISSDAIRAVETAQLVSKGWNFPHDKITYDDHLYENVNLSDFSKILTTIDDHETSLVIVGHNPWISYLGQQLSVDWNNILPTGSYLALDFKTEKWSDIQVRTGTVIEYMLAKKLM